MKRFYGVARSALLIFVWLGFLSSPCLFCTYVPRMIIHGHLRELTHQLENYPLPENSRTLHLESSVKENTGNGDYCLYLVRQTITTSLSKSEIEAYYADAVIVGVNEGGFEKIITASFLDGQSTSNELIYAIEVQDMTERYYDFGCK